MIYVYGDAPPWLINAINELNYRVIKLENCTSQIRGLVIDVQGGCYARNSVLLTLIPRRGAIVINRHNVRGVLKSLITLLSRINDAATFEDALTRLGFVRASVNDYFGVSEITISMHVEPGVVYSILAPHDGPGIKTRYRLALGRGTARGTLVIDSSIHWLFGVDNTVHVARGDLLLELMALSMIFSTNLELPNPPY
ncbi:MAG: hypothetical protein RXO23_05230 [Vulcanisaeta sp.]